MEEQGIKYTIRIPFNASLEGSITTPEADYPGKSRPDI